MDECLCCARFGVPCPRCGNPSSDIMCLRCGRNLPPGMWKRVNSPMRTDTKPQSPDSTAHVT